MVLPLDLGRALVVVAMMAMLPGCRGCDSSTSEAPQGLRNPLESCRDTLAAIAELPPERLDTWPVLYGQGCAGLYKEPRCRSAWAPQADASTRENMRRVLNACSEEYCPLLEGPKPQLCTTDRASAEPAALGALWPEFHAAVLSRDLGVARDAGVVLTINRLFVMASVPLERPADAATPPSVVIQLQMVGPKVEVRVLHDGGDKHWILTVSPSEQELAELRKEFEREGPTAESRAVIESTGDVSYGAVMKVLETAKAAGYSRIALSVARL